MKARSSFGFLHRVRTSGLPEARTKSPKRILFPIAKYRVWQVFIKQNVKRWEGGIISEESYCSKLARLANSSCDRSFFSRKRRICWPSRASFEFLTGLAAYRHTDFHSTAYGEHSETSRIRVVCFVQSRR